MDEIVDCLVVGGGAAGLSAALVLGRAGRRVLVLDTGQQSNLAARGIGGLLGNDRLAPADFYARAHAELTAYPTVEIRRAEVTGLRRTDAEEPRFGATLAGAGAGASAGRAAGAEVTARRILLAGGMEYRYPTVNGLAERWGHGVFHCPFCHGWEVHGRPLGVLGGGPIATHQARLLRLWSDDVTLLSNGEELGEDERSALATAEVRVDERPVREVDGPDSEVSAVRFEDGGELALGGLMVRVSLHQRSSLAAELGVASADPTPMSADAILVDALYGTSVPGVLAAGDVLGRPPSVSAAIADGNMAGAMIAGQLAGVM